MAERGRLAEVAALFTKLGVIGFGGPAAHIALMRDETVVRRRWVTEQEFLDLVGATNVLPGPSSTEMSMYLGRRRAGLPGLVVGGLCFIAPAVLIVGFLAWLYVRYGTTPVAGDVLWGVKAVVLAVIAGALLGLGRTAVTGVRTAVIAVAAFALFLLGVNELLLLGVGALVMLGTRFVPRGTPALVFAATAAATDVTLLRLGATFLKIGALLFGSGYVLIAFLERDLVNGLGWLTHQQLLDAVAVGQVTPGPLFSTATFVGYTVAGWSGAVVASIAIFLPSFLLVALTARWIERIRSSPAASAALDGVNAAAVGLLAGVLVVLAQDALTDAYAIGLAVVALGLVLWGRINSAWIVAAGAAIGLLRTLLS